MLNLLDYEQLPYISCIEGMQLGNGKTVLAVILAHYYNSKSDIIILSNIDFLKIETEKLTSEQQLFDAKNRLIIIDEFDLYAWSEDKKKGELFYTRLIKNLRKNDNKLIIITQQIHLIQAKVRRMINLICFPQITNVFMKRQNHEYKGNKIKSVVSPDSELIFQWYRYNEKIYRIIPYSEEVIIKDLFFWFDKYDTTQILLPFEEIEETEKKKMIDYF